MSVQEVSILCPAPFCPAGTTSPHRRLLPGVASGPPPCGGWLRIRSRSQSWCLRILRGCSRLFRCRCRLFPHQIPIYPRFLPPPLWDTCPLPPLRHLAYPQNRLCRNELRDRILSPEDRCPGPHDPRLLESTHQGGVDQLSVPPLAGQSSCQPLCYPALEGVQGRLHPLGKYPRLRPEEEDLLCHGSIKAV